MRRANVMAGVILAVFGLVMLVIVIPRQIGPGPDGMMSPSLVPSMMMIVITALSLILVISNIRARPVDARAEPAAPISRDEILALVRILGLFAVALGLHLWLSPLAAGFALVAGAQLVLGERRPLLLILVPAGFLGAIWLLFYKLLGTAIL
ncbi:tripartite tricarboxylate transporter TctB family protein [Hoeflea marina]|uniref:Tripartite tricarboxylate transporter TctB family protein n=1 Tax=Hoeflea marina TaxID=274592 RepID=A0A317PLU7_9HYPH|nr:tripartite tricarboxylate transporter TctB family protein [Hoeflea marina]PWW01483.1 tripartite tricarboxylate transporter TctB family protein [Hoeflea marina]